MSAVDKDAVISAIQRLAEQNGGVPIGKERFVSETGFRPYLWEGQLWLTWSDAVRDAGFQPNSMKQRRHADDELLRHLAALARKLGQFPTHSHKRMERRTNDDFPDDRVISHRFGTRSQQIDRG